MDYAEQIGVKLICAIEPDYPEYLRALDPPPPVISVLGRSDILRRPCVAIIGSRNASAIGQRFANSLAAISIRESMLIYTLKSPRAVQS